MAWLSENWTYLLVLVGVLLFAGHRRHGGCC